LLLFVSVRFILKRIRQGSAAIAIPSSFPTAPDLTVIDLEKWVYKIHNINATTLPVSSQSRFWLTIVNEVSIPNPHFEPHDFLQICGCSRSINMALARHVPNLITFSRIPLAVLHVVFILQGQYTHALITFTAICFSDLADGASARALAARTRLGELMDVVADVLYILSSLVALNIKGLAPVWFTGVVAIQFASFTAATLLFNIDRKNHIWHFDWIGRCFAVLIYLSPAVFYLGKLLPDAPEYITLFLLILACALAAASFVAKTMQLFKFNQSKRHPDAKRHFARRS